MTVLDAAIPEGLSLAFLREVRGEQALRNVVGITGGERAKTLSGLGELLAQFEKMGIDRGGTVLAVGGGTIGDLAGFAAAVWLRGIRLVHVPTTLLAMVDSSIGGKTGVNTEVSKNAVGAFWQPAAVLADPRFLATLPAEQVASGFGEIVKYALTLDPGLVELIETDPADLEEIVERCVRAKAAVVAADEREMGRRAVLNYGHTVGHAIEETSGYAIPHGKAIAAGMRAAGRIALRMGLCEPDFVALQDRLLARHGLPGPIPEAVSVAAVMAAIPRDKKARGGEIAWVLPRGVGRAETGHAAPPALVAEVLTEILAAG